MMNKWTQQDIRFCKKEGSKRYKTIKNGVTKIENQGENLNKMLQNGQMTDCVEKINQI